MPSSAKQSHTPESVRHRHQPTRTTGIYTSSNGKPGGLRWEVKYTDPTTGTQKWSPAFARRLDEAAARVLALRTRLTA